MLRPWLQRLVTRPAPKVALPRSRWREYRPWLEQLEDRLAPAVTASLIGTTLTVTLGAASDAAVLTGTTAAGTDIQVAGTGFATTTFNGVTDITVADGATNAGQSVTLTSAGTNQINLTGAINITGIESVILGTSTALQAASFAETGATTGVQINTTGVTTGGVQTYNDAVALGTGTTLDTTRAAAAGAAIGLAAVAGGGNTLTLNAGTGGVVTASGAVDNVSTLTVTNSGGATFQGGVGAGTAGAVTLSATTGTIAFQGAATGITTLTTATQGYNVSLTSTTTTVANAATFLNTGTVTLGGAAADSETFSGGLTVNGAAVTASLGTVNTGDLTVSTGSFSGSAGTVNSGNVTLAGGTLTAPSGPFNVAGNWSQTGGTFTPGGNTVTFTKGSGTQTLDSGGTGFGNVNHSGAGTLQLTGHGLTVGGTLANAGTLDLNGQGLSVTGAVTNTGTIELQGTEAVALTAGNDTAEGTWLYYGNNTAGPLTINDFGATDYFNLTINDPNATKATFRAGAALGVAGALTVTAGTYDANGNTTGVTGVTTVNGGTYLASSAAQTLGGGLSVSAGAFTGSAGTVSTAAVSLTGGTLTAPTTTLNVSGNFGQGGGMFAANGGTVVLTGTGQALGGATTFNNLSKTVATADTLTFGAGAGNKTTVTGTLTLQGASGNLLSLRSATPGSQWQIDPQGTRNVSFVDVKDSDNVNALAVNPASSVDSGNNTNWAILGAGGALTYGLPGGSSVTLRKSGTNLEIRNASNTLVAAEPLASVTSVTINGAPGTSNPLVIDYTFGGTFSFSGGITFNGGTLPGSTSSLTIQGGAFDTDTYSYTGAHSGTVRLGLGGQLISYTNLTPLTNTGTATNIVFNLPAGTVGASLQDDGTPGNGMSQLASTNATFETTTFADPSNSLTLNAGGGTDTISTAANFSGDFSAGLIINGTAATDAIALNALTLTAGPGNLSVTGKTIALNGGSVTTSASQVYTGAVTLGANTTLTSTGNGIVTLAGSVNGAFGLTINTGGTTTFGGSVGGSTALTSVTTDVAGSTALNGGAVTTTGAQTFNDAVTLGAATTLTSTGSGNVTLPNTVNGAFALTVNTAGTTTFGGAVGGTTALTSVTTDAAGTTALNGGSVTTSGAQTYNDAVTLGAGTTLTSTGSGNVTLANTVNGAFSLAINTAGTTTFGGAVGGTTALTSLTTDAGGTTALNGGAVTTTGAQAYNDPVTLGINTTLTSTGGGNATLADTVNGAFALTVNTAGTTTFGGAVGGTTALTSVTTDAAGSTRLNGGAVTTSVAQTYNDPVTLGANTTLASTGSGNVMLAGTVNGAFALTVNTAGTTTFGAAVGGTTALLSLTTDAGGSSSLRSVTTTGAQTYNDGSITLNGAAYTTTANGSLSAAGAVTLTVPVTVATGSGAITLSSTLGEGTNLLTIRNAASATPSSIGGAISGSGGLLKDGSSTLILAGISPLFTGPTTLDAGTVLVNGLVKSVATLNQQSAGVPAVLGGTGTVGGIRSLAADGGGFVEPGTSASTANLTSTGDVTLNNANSFYRVEPSTAPYSVLQLTGGAHLNVSNAVLQASLAGSVTATPDVNNILPRTLIIDGTGPTPSRFGSVQVYTGGTFTGTPVTGSGADSTVFYVSVLGQPQQQYQLAYVGGSGLLDPTNVNVTLTHLDALRNSNGTVVPAPSKSGQSVPVVNQAVATFTDDAGRTLDNFEALIDWGDNLPGNQSISFGQVTGPAKGTHTVTGSHTYAVAGKYPITVEIVLLSQDPLHPMALGLALAQAQGLAHPRFSAVTLQGVALVGDANAPNLAASVLAQKLAGQPINLAALNRFNNLGGLTPDQLQTLGIAFQVATLQTSTDSLRMIVDHAPVPGAEVPGVWQQFFGPAAVIDARTLSTYIQYLSQVGDREGLSVIVAGSAAYFQKAGRDPVRWVMNLYHDYFNVTLPPSPATAGLIQFWVGLLNRGTSRLTIAHDIIASPLGDEVQIQYLYKAVLGRNASQMELDIWEQLRTRQSPAQTAADWAVLGQLLGFGKLGVLRGLSTVGRAQLSLNQIELDLALSDEFRRGLTAGGQAGKFTLNGFSIYDLTELPNTPITVFRAKHLPLL